MVESYIVYFCVGFFMFCLGGFIGSSFAKGYYKAVYDKKIKDLPLRDGNPPWRP